MSKQTIKSNREYILRVSTGGVCLALAFVLSQLKLFEMPMGGTVTPASTLPIIVYGVAFGPVWGFVLAFIFSLLQLIRMGAPDMPKERIIAINKQLNQIPKYVSPKDTDM